jgi:signal transduction histidine kinase
MRTHAPSILSRIIWLHVLAVVCISIAVSVASFIVLNSTANELEERILRDHANVVAAALALRDGKWSLDLPADLRTVYSRGYGGYALAIIDDAGRTVFSTLGSNEGLAVVDSKDTQISFFHQRRDRSFYYGIILPVSESGGRAWIEVAQNLESPDVVIDDVAARFFERIAWIALACLAVLLVADVLIVRRALAPLLGASQSALLIGPNTINARIPTKDLPREALPLVQAINQVLDRLQRGFQAQGEFAADAAHELRTPLSVIKTHIDTQLDPKVARALQSDIASMSRIVDQLLDLTELESISVLPGEKADLLEICSAVVGSMAPLALSSGKSAELIAGPESIWVPGNSEMLLRAIRNLVDNAIRLTEPGTTVEVELASDATVSVKDRGPGVPLDERALIFRRFWRHDRRDKGHSGLGLSIVERTLQIHGGTIEVSDRPGGGAIFRVHFSSDAASGTP